MLDANHTQGGFDRIAASSPTVVFLDSLDGLEEPVEHMLVALKAFCLKNPIAIVATTHNATRAHQIHADVVLELMPHKGEFQQLRVVKNRQGATGEVRLARDMETLALTQTLGAKGTSQLG